MSDVLEAEFANEARAWQLPNMDGRQRPTTARDLEKLQKQAWNEAWEQGKREGEQAGQAELMAQAKRLKTLADRFTDVTGDLDAALEQELAEFTMLIARRVIRRELKMNPELILDLIREALQAMPMSSRNIVLHMHPDDVRLVREKLAVDDGEMRWKAVADPMIERGGLRVTSESSLLDVTLQRRIQQIASQILGDDRSGASDDKSDAEAEGSSSEPQA